MPNQYQKYLLFSAQYSDLAQFFLRKFFRDYLSHLYIFSFLKKFCRFIFLAWFPSTFGDWVWIDWDWHHSYCHHKLHSQPRTAQLYELPKRQNRRNGTGRKLKRQKESQTCCSFEKSRRNSELGSLIWKNKFIIIISNVWNSYKDKKVDIAYLKKFILALRRKLLYLKAKIVISNMLLILKIRKKMRYWKLNLRKQKMYYIIISNVCRCKHWLHQKLDSNKLEDFIKSGQYLLFLFFLVFTTTSTTRSTAVNFGLRGQTEVSSLTIFSLYYLLFLFLGVF